MIRAHAVVWYIGQLLREEIIRLLITMGIFFLFSLHYINMGRWMLAEPIIIISQ